MLHNELSTASRELAALGASFLHPPKSPVALGDPCCQLLQFKCDVGVIAHSLASLHLLRLQWAPRESKRVDPLHPCNSDAEYDTKFEEAAAAYGLDDDDDPYCMW